MNARIASVLAACALAACAGTPPHPAAIDPATLDPAIRPQDDLYRYVNARWEAATQIPADKARWGSYVALHERTEQQLHGIVDDLVAGRGANGDPDAQRVRDLYASFMDEARIATLGAKPIAGELARVDRLASVDDVPELIAHLSRIGVDTPFAPEIHQDAKRPTVYIVDLGQSGLGMPDRDYYLKRDDERLAAIRAEYRKHVARMLAEAGVAQPAAQADAILGLETRLAEDQWTRVANRDPVKTYNPVAVGDLERLAPGFGWNAYLAGAGFEGRIDRVIVSQPSYLTAFAHRVSTVPLETWKAYFRWRVVEKFARYLSRPLEEESFAFNGRVLTGTPQELPRWERAIALVNGLVRDGLGRLYVQRFFPAESKARMDTLVANLLAAYRVSIDGLDWMGPETKRAAQAKLALFRAKIGYPVKWRDYSRLAIDPTDLVGNVMRGEAFEYDRNLAKLGQPVDRTEWYMGPQAVNAYYDPEKNEVVFPAAILQPPFFDVNADDAVNYGAIGAVIGHEISHGYDDEGSQYDGEGRLRDWWTKQDHERFHAKTEALVAQYSAYSPVAGYHVNGELTLGENIADNSGLAIAWKAYTISLHGAAPPVVDGIAGDRRFFLSWARIWRQKTREEEQIREIKVDPHAPDPIRANAAARNQAAFEDAFGVKPGDGMWRPPDERVVIW